MDQDRHKNRTYKMLQFWDLDILIHYSEHEVFEQLK